MDINSSARNALLKCMALKGSESCLIVTDSGKQDIGKAFYEEAKNITSCVTGISRIYLESMIQMDGAGL